MGQTDTKNERKEKEKTRRVETAKFFYDLSKFSFSITFLGSLASMFKNGAPTPAMVFGASIGVIMSVVFFIIGYKILNK